MALSIQSEIKQLSSVEHELSIVVPGTEVARELDKAYRELGMKVRLKGFRQGKVPRYVLEQYYKADTEQQVLQHVHREQPLLADRVDRGDERDQDREQSRGEGRDPRARDRPGAERERPHPTPVERGDDADDGDLERVEVPVLHPVFCTARSGTRFPS